MHTKQDEAVKRRQQQGRKKGQKARKGQRVKGQGKKGREDASSISKKSRPHTVSGRELGDGTGISKRMEQSRNYSLSHGLDVEHMAVKKVIESC